MRIGSNEHMTYGKKSSGSTEEAIYYTIDGANDDGTYIIITEIFGTNDLNFYKEGQEEKWKKDYDKVPYDEDHR